MMKKEVKEGIQKLKAIIIPENFCIIHCILGNLQTAFTRTSNILKLTNRQFLHHYTLTKSASYLIGCHESLGATKDLASHFSFQTPLPFLQLPLKEATYCIRPGCKVYCTAAVTPVTALSQRPQIPYHLSTLPTPCLEFCYF